MYHIEVHTIRPNHYKVVAHYLEEELNSESRVEYSQEIFFAWDNLKYVCFVGIGPCSDHFKLIPK